MDFPIEFLWALFIGVYYLLGALRKKKAAQRRQAPQDPLLEGTSEPRPATPFQDFMRQMEESMREASGETPPATQIDVPPTPEAMPSAMPVPTRRPITATSVRPSEFHSLGSFERERSFESADKPPHEVHGFGQDNPFSEERFERLQRGKDVTEHKKGHLTYDPHGRSKRTVAAKPLSTARLWRQRLKDPKQAQDALVLAEIFGGPWSPRRPHKR